MALNEIVTSDKYPLPEIDDIIDAMQGNKWFTVLDLKEGYFQIKLAEEDRHKTAFTINQKKYEWNRMPMGYKNSPAIFQRIMEKELRQWIGKGCLIYLDDIVINGKTMEEHDKVLLEILKHLKEKSFKINVEKIQLRKEQVKLLELIINGERIEMPKEIKQKILVFQVPKTKKDLQRFKHSITEIIQKLEIWLVDFLRSDRGFMFTK